MLKRFATILCVFASLAGTALAQSCPPEQLAEAVDRYAAAPFSARSWRVLLGLGDPMIDMSYSGEDSWAQQNRWKKLAEELAPGAEALSDIGWNCRIGYPLAVLEKRMGSLGEDHPYVKQWLLAQEQVLRACSNESDAVSLPPPLQVDPVYANLQKRDRAYQEASIAFYRDKQRAIPLFRAIAGSNSPHRAAARYNIANLLANAKQPEAARQEAQAILADPSMASVHAITRELLGYIANQEDTAEGWTGVIERNVAILETSADTIRASSDLSREYATALYDIDFVGVRGKDDDWWLDGTLPEDPTISKALVDTSRKHPMVLWMMAGQTGAERYRRLPWSLVGEKWQARMESLVSKATAIQPAGAAIKGPALDMLKALAAKPDDATRAELWSKAKAAIAAAEQGCGTAPETAAAGFLLSQAVRLSAMAGKYDEINQSLEVVPFKTAGAFYDGAVYRTAQYLVGQGNAAEARKLRDRFIDASRLKDIEVTQNFASGSDIVSLLALIAEDEAKWKEALRLANDPAADLMLNLLPTKRLWQMSEDVSFAADIRAIFARAAWTRDYALRRKISDERTAALHALNPPMKEIADKAKADYPQLGPERLRLLTILRSPRHNILVAMPSGWNTQGLKAEDFAGLDSWDHNDKNWWCPLEIDRQLGAIREQADDVTGVPGADDYGIGSLKNVIDDQLRATVSANRDTLLKSHPMMKAVDWKEVRALNQMPSAPKRLAEAALRWAKGAKADDGAAEALALAVKATRYGCNWHGSHERYSKPAHELLQAKFGTTDWAKQTPYWFGCTDSEWDAEGNRVTTCEPKVWPKQEPLR